MNEPINKSGFRSQIGGGGGEEKYVSRMIEALNMNTEKEIRKYGFVSTSSTSGNEDYQVKTKNLKYNGELGKPLWGEIKFTLVFFCQRGGGFN